LFATYLGGNSNEWCSGVALDETGSVYVTGGTRSPNFPTSADAYARVYAGEADIFLAKLNSSGSSLLYATLLGGSEWEEGVAISVDGYGRACFTGGTRSRNFPTTVGAFSRTLSGTRDAFVAVVNPTASGLLYSSFLGGSRDDWGLGVAMNDSGDVYITGATGSSDFPVHAGAFDAVLGGSWVHSWLG